jgi:hypothetical protein
VSGKEVIDAGHCVPMRVKKFPQRQKNNNFKFGQHGRTVMLDLLRLA